MAASPALEPDHRDDRTRDLLGRPKAPLTGPRRIRSSRRYETRRQILIAELATGDTHLDLGYAQDPNPYLRGYRVGFDLQLPAPHDRHYDEEIVGDVHQLPRALEGRTFDTVICAELIEHLEDPYTLLRNVKPLLKPGGRLLISTPNPVGLPTVLWEWSSSGRRFYTPEHAWYLAPRWVERMLAATGWRVLATRGVGLWPFGAPSLPPGLSYQVIYVAEPTG